MCLALNQLPCYIICFVKGSTQSNETAMLVAIKLRTWTEDRRTDNDKDAQTDLRKPTRVEISRLDSSRLT